MWVPPLLSIWRCTGVCQYSCCVFSCFSTVVYHAFWFIFRIPGIISRPISSLWKLKWTIMRSILQRLREWFNNAVHLEHTLPRICELSFTLSVMKDESDKILRYLWLIYQSNTPAHTFTVRPIFSVFLIITTIIIIIVNNRPAYRSSVILLDIPPSLYKWTPLT